jgi:hypothetical protein
VSERHLVGVRRVGPGRNPLVAVEVSDGHAVGAGHTVDVDTEGETWSARCVVGSGALLSSASGPIGHVIASSTPAEPDFDAEALLDAHPCHQVPHLGANVRYAGRSGTVTRAYVLDRLVEIALADGSVECVPVSDLEPRS